MTKKHEELVNEIAGELNILFCAGRDGGIPKQLPQDLAESLIALILSAVCARGLDEELGVVGRRILEEREPVIEWPTKEIKENIHSHLEILIALRGTGKEEEEDDKTVLAPYRCQVVRLGVHGFPGRRIWLFAAIARTQILN